MQSDHFAPIPRGKVVTVKFSGLKNTYNNFIENLILINYRQLSQV